MLIDRRSSVFLIIILGVVSSAHAAAPQAVVREGSATKRAKPIPLHMMNNADAARSIRRIEIENPRVLSFYKGSEGVVAGAPPGVEIYRNITDLQEPLFIYPPGSETMADDLELTLGGCDTLAWYEIAVLGLGTSGHITFNVHTELRTGPACDPSAALIAGSEADFTGLPNDGTTISFLGAPIPTVPAVPVPGTVWLWVTITAPDVGWVIADQAELGSTANIFSKTSGCTYYFPDDPTRRHIHAGFWAKVNCELSADPVGACCLGATCSQSTQGDCDLAGGVWQGAFTSCPCGSCCTGEDFAACSQITESSCLARDGFFHESTTCDQGYCKPTFEAYVNDFFTGFFSPMPFGAQWADDIHFPPCDELVAFSIDMVGAAGTGNFDVRTELWTNDDKGTSDPTDDTPLAPIEGTFSQFSGVAADYFGYTLRAGPFPKIPTDGNVWVVFSTSSPEAGPSLGGEATTGFSGDWFAVINDPDIPESNGQWVGNVGFPGDFNPDTCPGGNNCIPHDSFHIRVWCQGDPPRGTCCNDAAGTYVNGVQEAYCDGRWIVDPNGDANSFSPVCGLGACCSQFGCFDRLFDECMLLGQQNNMPVSFTGGQSCNQTTCPRPDCLGAPGGCFENHLSTGCSDPVCCDTVCTLDDLCCSDEWSGFCVETANRNCTPTLANDHCRDALPIEGVGSFDFDTTLATTDGAPHQGCLDAAGQDHIIGDLWYRWTSPCNGNITVTTCNMSDVDTKIAVYDDGGSCPPSDAELVACNDDACAADRPQSTVVFRTSIGEKKLIRLGMFPTEGRVPGTGQFLVLCGAPLNAACPGAGGCCADNGSPGCETTACCNAVCAADPYCCTDTWDAACASTGRIGLGGGAAVLCAECRLGGDLDGSGFIDLDDWGLFVDFCLEGPGTQWTKPMCEAADFDSDGNIDAVDIDGFMQVFNTPAP